ncbi:hypothetical protein L2E82_24544 [Cichorium intybus]|uniref:Uncharacterized protein n=1 Tax=Cichorium intybus TaxID=13427 RepID=A0ACB9E1B7_CICIN|nr:hypothetical protein L2E82_24544 [Cichorium intybus]
MAPSRHTPMCLLVYLCFGLFGMFVRAEEVTYNWEVNYMSGAPDCMEKEDIIGINGQFPGPTINARAGDNVVVYLTNKLHDDGVVIHWHGIRQLKTPWADGTAAISQCPIKIGETFKYNFTVEKAGTYFYHGHLGMQRSAGLYGMLIVDVEEGKKEPFHYDGEFSLLLSDWWHTSIKDQEHDLNAVPMNWIGEAQSLLLNGKGQYNCTLAVPANSKGANGLPGCKFTGNEQCAPNILDVEPGKTYRLRVASTTALAALNVAIESHNMMMVEADGNYLQPFWVKDFDIYSGESYSVIFRTHTRSSNNYWISVGIRGRDPTKTARGLAMLHYKSTKVSKRPMHHPPTTHRWNDYAYSKSFSNKIFALTGSPTPPVNYDHRIFLLNTQNYFEGQTKWAINNVSLMLTDTPYLGSIRYGLTGSFDQNSPPLTYPDTYDITKPPPNPNCTVSSAVYTLEFGKTYDVILQNADMLKAGDGEIHPWHLHGHDFWVLGYGEGKFSKKDEKNLNLENPPLRNTAVVFPGGWTALRFMTDNPGVWAFHCHIEPHLHMGMGVIFAEGVHLVRKIPDEALSCGDTGKMLMSQNHN